MEIHTRHRAKWSDFRMFMVRHTNILLLSILCGLIDRRRDNRINVSESPESRETLDSHMTHHKNFVVRTRAILSVAVLKYCFCLSLFALPIPKQSDYFSINDKIPKGFHIKTFHSHGRLL